MSRLADLGAQLQSGERSINIINRRRTWFLISAVLIVISLAGLGTRQLTLGVEFEGGSVFEATRANLDVDEVREVVEAAGGDEPVVQELGSDRVRIETGTVTAEDANAITAALSDEFGIPLEEITTQVVGPTWGGDVTNKALLSLAIFLALLMVYLAIAFEPKMAAGAIAALLHDLMLTIGIYSIVGFTVTPATVIGLLTILGYSLYDTVVVYDRVRENTANLASQSKMSYSGAANLAVNQTLVRSVNTTLIALLPVAGLLFVGAGLLGAGTLKDLALVLFVGMAVGAYSSICIATPVTAALREREPAMQALAKRVAQRDAALRKSGADKKGPAGAGLQKGPDGADTEHAAAANGGAAVPAAAAARAGASPGERMQPRKGGTRSQRTGKKQR